MPRSLSLLVLLAMAGCAPAPGLLSPRVKPPPMPKPWLATIYRVDGLATGRHGGMPVVVPDTTRLERMPVFRPDATIDRAMVVQGGGTTPRLRGPAKVVPLKPSADSLQRSAP